MIIIIMYYKSAPNSAPHVWVTECYFDMNALTAHRIPYVHTSIHISCELRV